MLIRSGAGPLELGMFSRTLLLAAGVGIAAGLVGAAFVASVDLGTHLFLERLAGANLLRASGEGARQALGTGRVPWFLLVVPAAGALLGGLLSRWAPEAAGGGGDQTIATYHDAQATVRPRLLPVKFLASVATLATGGAGGREGPAMQLGSTAGALIAEWLPTTARERRLLFVAGIGAGISAVFRTPLGAALLAVEILYRDDFDADALVPSVLASVVSFAVSNAILGTRPLFGTMPSHPFVAGHLPFYALLAVVASAAGALFVWALHGVRNVARDSGLPRWLTPALGGLGLGGGIIIVYAIGLHRIGPAPVESALLGGGYGLAQLAVAEVPGPSMAVAGWFLALALLRIVATAFTVGSGGSAGDFAPALVVGALVGAAFGHAAGTLFPESHIHPASFALVGMATLYGGVAHVPLSAVVLVSELASSYDLLVPLMLGTVGAHVLLRKVKLYESQQPNRRSAGARVLVARGEEPRVRAPEVPVPLVTVPPTATLLEVMAAASNGQPVIPVVDEAGNFAGLIDSTSLLALSADQDLAGIVAVDLAGPAVGAEAGEPVRDAVARILDAGLSHAPVVEGGRIVGMLSLSDVVKTALGGELG
ncbi:MAG TPA: chloride channel protein [Anaeromyxobacteraceae bacterium]|nr:chloride channel protein [Anaeromyxobacteraceae bacterium]